MGRLQVLLAVESAEDNNSPATSCTIGEETGMAQATVSNMLKPMAENPWPLIEKARSKVGRREYVLTERGAVMLAKLRSLLGLLDSAILRGNGDDTAMCN